MAETFRCGDDAALIAYLYEECEPAEREEIAAHASVCPQCAAELSGLAATRRHLAAWSPPEAHLGFRVSPADAETVVDARAAFRARGQAVPDEQPVARDGWWRRPLPAWAQVAAAMVIFASGMAAGTAWQGSGTEAPAASGAAGASVIESLATLEGRIGGVERTLSSRDVTVLEERLAGIERTMSQVQRAGDAQGAFRARASFDEAGLRRWVRTVVAESEERQRRELAKRTTMLASEVEGQRRQDVQQIQTMKEDVNSLARMVTRPVRVNYNGQ